MRVFAALVPPPEVREHLGARLSTIKASYPALRWTPPRLWHLTLAFLPDVPAAALPDLSGRLGETIGEVAAPTLRIVGGGAFPGVRRAHVVWVGLDHREKHEDPVIRLAERVAVASAPHRPDSRDDYHPHLTVARTRRPLPVHDVVADLAHYRGPAWRAREVRLVESDLRTARRGGPRYETLAVFPLGAGS